MANASRLFRSLWRQPVARPARRRLAFTRLEDRLAPSISIPLNAFTWTQIGPTPIGSSADAATQATPGNLTTAGRTFGLASPNPPAGATPAQIAAATNTLLATTVSGGVWRSTDSGANWQSTTDNLTGLTILDRGNAPAPLQDRTLKMGALAYSPVDANIVWAGQGNPGFTDALFTPGGQNRPGFSDLNYAGRGLLKSADGGLTWQLIKGPPVAGGAVAFEGVAIVKVVPHPTDPDTAFVVTKGQADTVYGAFVPSAVWRTTDGGLNWVNIAVNLPQAQGTALPVDRFRPITDFTLNPQNPDVAYLAVGDPSLFVPGQAYENNGVYQTLNALAPLATDVVFRVSFGGTGGGSGTSPIPGTTLGASRVEVAPSNPAIVYATVAQVNTPAGGQALRMYRTADAGTNWLPVSVPAYIEGATPGITVGYGGYNQALLIDPNNANRLVIGGRSTGPGNPNALYVSVDGGNTWVDISSNDGTGATPGPQQTVRTLRWDAAGRMLAATDGGAFRFTFNSSTTGSWESLNGGPGTGLSNVEVISVSVPAVSVNTYTASTYGNGTVLFQDPGDPVLGPIPPTIVQNGQTVPNPAYLALFQPPVTDPTPFGGSVQYDATNPNIVYRAISRTNGQGRVTIVRSTDGGLTWANTTGQPGDPGNSSFDQPAFELDPGDSRRLVAGTDRIQISENGGRTWGASLSLLGPNTSSDPYDTPGGIGGVLLGGGDGNLPLVTGRPAPYANPGVPVTAVGQGRSNFRVMYVAVQDRSRTITGGEQIYGPALYRIDTTFPENSNGITSSGTAFWRDVSPGRFYWVPPGETPPTNPFPNNISGLPGFPLPGTPFIPMGFQVPAWGMRNELQGRITDIVVDPTNENILYVTVDADTARGRVYRSINGGETWTDIGVALGQIGDDPLSFTGNLRAYTTVFDPNTPGTKTDDTVYVGTSVAVWSLTDPTLNEVTEPNPPFYPGNMTGRPTTVNVAAIPFTRVGQLAGAPDGLTGLPDVQVSDLRINTTTGLLAAATFGRGVWQLQIRPLLSGVLFEDTDGNGVRNARPDGSPEPAQGGVLVEAFDVNNNTQAAVTTTLSNGFFEFRSLPNGTYRIGVVGGVGAGTYITTGLLPTPNTFTIDQTTTIPGNTGPGGVPRITPPADIGSFRLTSINGVLYDDLNGNGVRDKNEPGRAGVTVQLQARNKAGAVVTAINPATGLPVPAVTTDATGKYTFTGLAPFQDKSGFDPATGYFVNPYLVRQVQPAGTVQSSVLTPDVRLTSGVGFVTDTDIGNFTLVTIQGTVFDDTNGDGVRQGEPRLGGVTVTLLDPGADGKIGTADDKTLGTRVSDPNGGYAFANLGPGTYYVRQEVATLPAGYRPTTANPQGPIVPQSGQGLASPPRDPSVPATFGPFDFGNFRDAGLSGTVFEDDNGDGRRQPSETRPIVGATVVLIDPGPDGNSRTEADNVILATTTTDAAGNYSFAGLQPLIAGNTRPYFVRVVQPSNLFVQTSADGKVSLSSGIVTGGLNLGYFRRTVISGFAFEDINGNGVQDAGEPAAANFPVSLLNSDNPSQVVGVATTDATGQYRFAYDPANPAGFSGGPLQLNADTQGPGGAVIAYRIAVNLPNVIQTNAPGDLVLTSGVPAAGPVLALFRTVGFGGTVYDDVNGNGVRDSREFGVGGVRVQLVTASGAVAVNQATGLPIETVTAADGRYLLQAPNGTFTVRLADLPAGTITTTLAPSPILTTSGAVLPPIDLGTFATVTLSGAVYDDLNGNGFRDAGEPGLANLEVRLTTPGGAATPFSTVTDGAGNYTLAGVGPGTFRLAPALPPGVFLVNPATALLITTSSGQSFLGTDFGVFRGATVAGNVFEDLNRSGAADANEPGSPGWTVQVVNAAGAVIASGTADPQGNYLIGGVPAGAFAVQLADRPGWLRTLSPVPLGGALTSGGSATAGRLGGVRLGSVSGRVFNDANRNGRLDNSETGLVGAVVELVQNGNVVASRTSTAGGGFEFLGVAGGTYTLRLSGGSLDAGRVQTGPQESGLVYTVVVREGSGTAGNALVAQDFGVAGRKRYAVAADGGGGPRVQVYDAVSGALVSDQFVYEESFRGGVRVATGDVNGDGVDDLVTVAGVGGGPRVRAIDGVTGATLYDYFAYEPTFRLGLFVAVADVDGDGFADIITGTDSGGGPRVTVFSGRDGRQLLDFFAFDSDFRGGVRIGAGDINGDGRAEIIAASGIGLGAEVRVFDGTGRRINTFAPVDPSFTGGLFVAGGATDPSTGRANLLVGTGAGFAEQGYAFVFDGLSGQQIFQFEAFPQGPGDTTFYTGDVRVASFDTTGDSVPEIAIASGAGTRSMVRFLDGNNRREINSIFPFEPQFLGGLFVG